jgi:hypothetical protein
VLSVAAELSVRVTSLFVTVTLPLDVSVTVSVADPKLGPAVSTDMVSDLQLP